MRLLTVLFLIFTLIITEFQCQIILNPSFEGTPGIAVCPPSWYACGLYSSPDTQPGQYNVTMAAENGSSYVSLVTRASNGMQSDGNVEAIGQTLGIPLQKDQCYSLDIALMSSSQFTFDSFGDPYHFTFPTKLRIWGGDSMCKKSQLLLQTETINKDYWKHYSYTIKPNNNYSNIIFEAYYPYTDARLNGNLCLDNIKLVKTNELPISITNVLLPHSEDSIQLNALPGYSYIWTNSNQYLTCSNCPNPFVNLSSGSQTFTVQLTDPNSCEYIQVFNVEKEVVFPQIFIPELITPNNDGKNDNIKFGADADCDWYVEIYNRWGNIICKLDKNKPIWDGTYDGGACPSGVYFYLFEITCKITEDPSAKKHFKGFIQLMR